MAESPAALPQRLREKADAWAGVGVRGELPETQALLRESADEIDRLRIAIDRVKNEAPDYIKRIVADV